MTSPPPDPCYRTRISLVWGLLPLSVVLGLAALVASAFVSTDALAYAFIALGVLLLLYRIVYGLRGPTARVLAGGLPCALLGGPAPRTRAELRAAIRRAMSTPSSPPPTFIGSGWGFYSLRRRAPAGSRIFTHRLCGPDPDRPNAFLAGSTIAGVMSAMRRDPAFRTTDTDGRVYPSTFWSTPSITTIALAGWLVPTGHGSKGSSGRPSSAGIAALEVWDVRDVVAAGDDDDASVAQLLTYKELRRRLDTTDGGRFLVLVSVILKPARLAPDICVQKRLIEVRDDSTKSMEELACEWLAPGAYLRVLFIGSARPYGFGLRWERPYDADVTRTCCFCLEVPHVDEHGFSKECRALQGDTCSAVCGWNEPPGPAWRGLSTLSTANQWTPLYTPPIGALAIMLTGIKNFEVIFRLGDGGMDVDGNALAALVRALGEYHTASGSGRSEVRYGGETRLPRLGDEEEGERDCATRGVMFIDFGIKSAGFAGAFAVLRQFGVTRCALHSSKYQGEDLLRAAEGAGVIIVPAYRVYWP